MTTPDSMPIAQAIALPGPVWGACPERAEDSQDAPRRGTAWRGAARCRRLADAAMRHAAQWQTTAALDRPAALAALGSALRRDGLQGEALSRALGAVAATADTVLGQRPYPSQLFAAAALLENRMAEMATGEGKTLAIALAAAVGALAGIPVHVITANDYLAGRDAEQLAPLYAALGLASAHLAADQAPDAKRETYSHDIVYSTAKELAFDYLRDRLATGPLHDVERAAAALAGGAAAAPMMRGLCFALLDEADSILLDEAEVPLILSRAVPHAARRAFLWQALAVARQLDAEQHFVLVAGERRVELTALGEEQIGLLTDRLGGPWRRLRWRREAITTALTGLHLQQRDAQYLVRDGRIDLLDEVTGRVAPGRVWSRGLHTIVEMKEGLAPTPETETLTQITFQRFFLRYWRLGGISGTLLEARAELRSVYHADVVQVPLHRPGRRVELAPCLFADDASRFAAACERVRALQSAGRPVLVGTDSVADSHAFSERLTQAGVAHRVLNAVQDANEADIVARAGEAGCVTVATRMAGRGTDIVLDAAARAAGGLHVLSLQHNPSRRLDRQLAGRAARQGDPGSAESWLLPAYSLLRQPAGPPKLRAWNPTSAFLGPSAVPPPRSPALRWRVRWAQWREERRRAALRALLLRQHVESQRRLSFAGRSD